MTTFSINKRSISKNHYPYIIAELSANHNGSLKKALASIQAAKDAGADAVKIQTYTADTMTIDSGKEDFIVKGGLWKGYKLYNLYEEAHTPYEWHKDLFEFARKIGITIFSTPFDETAVDLLEELNTPAYKIASFELCDLPLIKYIAKKNKPILMSTGMASLEEIRDAVSTAKDNGCQNLFLFHCISSYPTPIEDTNLKNINFLRKQFGVEVGLSDHTIGNTAAIASISLGASAIEKHFTLNRQEKGPDSEFSIEPEELYELQKATKETWLSLGAEGLVRPKNEKSSKVFRRSLYFIKNLKKGTFIKTGDIKRIRPGYGIKPKFEGEIYGKKLIKDVEIGDSVTWDKLEN